MHPPDANAFLDPIERRNTVAPDVRLERSASTVLARPAAWPTKLNLSGV
jgi:hypothetical protein